VRRRSLEILKTSTPKAKKDSNKEVDRTAEDRNSFLKVFDKKQVQRTEDEDDTPDLS